MIRVAHLNAGNLYGGIESFLVTLARIAASRRTQLDQLFLFAYEGRFSEELRRAGATVRMVGPARLSRPWSIWSAQRRVRSALSEFATDVVLAHDTWPLVVLGRGAREHPLVYYQHMPAGEALLDKLAGAVSVQAVVANSYFTSASASKLFPRVPVHVVRYPVLAAAKSSRASVRAALGIAPDELVILQVSRLQRWKGQLLHLSALRYLKSGRRWRAWFVGGAARASENKLLEEMRKTAAPLPPGRVSFLGERSDVPLLMRAADVFCQPNVGPEPFGLVFVEALTAGVPVVTTRMGGALEIVDESVGVTTEPTAEAVAAALDLLLEDDGLRARLSAAGPERAERLCGSEACLSSLLTVLERRVQGTGTRTAADRWD